MRSAGCTWSKRSRLRHHAAAAGDVPTILRADLYALGAAGIVSLGQVLNAPPLPPMLLGAAACVFLRLMAIHRGWHVPVARRRADGNE